MGRVRTSIEQSGLPYEHHPVPMSAILEDIHPRPIIHRPMPGFMYGSYVTLRVNRD
jgi:hypothetical protein